MRKANNVLLIERLPFLFKLAFALVYFHLSLFDIYLILSVINTDDRSQNGSERLLEWSIK